MSEPDWKKLNAFQHARLRTEMYFGSRDPHTQTVLEYDSGYPVPVETTWVPAVFTALREVYDNALDEIVTHGHGDRLDITYKPNAMVFTIQDNGRGIPIDFNKKEGAHAATILLSNTMAGRNFSDERGQTRGLNGVGASIVNYCSEYFKLDIWRERKHFAQRFHEGEAKSGKDAPDADLVIEDPIIISAPPKTPTGTRVEFKLSGRVFKNMALPESFVRARVFELALCYPQTKIFYNGERVTAPKKMFANAKPVEFNIEKPGFRSSFWLIPNFAQTGGYEHSLVNGIPAFNGGVHVDTFKSKFFSGLLAALERESKKRKLTPNRNDIDTGLLIYNITQMDAPSFDSQSKTRLINESVGKIVAVELAAPDFFKTVIRKYPEWIDSIYERCAERTQKKDSKAAGALNKKRHKIEELTDASGMDRSKCILFLAEGNSAISGMVEARDARIHGGLPLRGKVLNTHPSESTMKQAIENLALSKIMKSIGLVPGQRVNRLSLRYGKVYITTDADEDGKNIAALLVNFFYTFWPELFDPKNPYVYILDTPLIIAVKGKTRKYWYAENYHEFKPEAHKGWAVTRAKGLAALKKPDWQMVLAEPKLRAVYDDGELKPALDLLFSKGKAPDGQTWPDKRKEWMAQ